MIPFSVDCVAPILYVTGQSNYEGVLTHANGCTESDLWNELQSTDKIKQELLNAMRDSELDQFRMVIHKTQRMKLSYNKNGGMKDESKCKYFALIWTLYETEKAMQEYTKLIAVMRESKYFVNPLNKECIYISGPKYGEYAKNQTIWNESFDLIPLERICRESWPDSKAEIDIEIAVHELDQKLWEEDQKDFNFEVFRNDYDSNDIRLIIEDSSLDHKEEKEPQYNAQRSISFAGVPNTLRAYQYNHDNFKIMQSSQKDESEQINNHAFAFIWFTVKRPNFSRYASITRVRRCTTQKLVNFTSNTSVNRRKTGKSKLATFSSKQSDDKSIPLINVRAGHQDAAKDKDGIFYALCVLHGLHQRASQDRQSKSFDVELMGYDECFENMNLLTNTYSKSSWTDSFWVLAFLVILQWSCLPIFILIPPFVIMKCCNKKFVINSRYRPHGKQAYDFQDLDTTEQIPYDISALWRSPKTKISVLWKCVEIIISVIYLYIIYTGPTLYSTTNKVGSLTFSDCFAPILFHFLGMMTIIFWSCIYRGTIGPKEHNLLYYKMIIQKPAPSRTTKPKNDFDALTYLSERAQINTFGYAHSKGFFQVKTPRHKLLSIRVFSCKKKFSWIFYILSIIIFCGAENLEDFQRFYYPFYVNPDDDHYIAHLIYCICSNILSWFQLFCFIALLETMMNRISRQYDNIRNLTNLIIRNTESEYIELNYADNMLSWLGLYEFIKRKGMMLFTSLETPLFSLFVLSLISWSGTIYCIFWGVGLKLTTDKSLFSNSALATWLFLAILSFIHVTRLLYYGHRFNRESVKQIRAIKTQCNTIHSMNIIQLLKTNKLSSIQKNALQSTKILLQHFKDHNEIVPRVFGIKFDKLTAKAVWTAVLSAIPTILTYITAQLL